MPRGRRDALRKRPATAGRQPAAISLKVPGARKRTTHEQLVDYAEAFIRQRARGHDPRPPESGEEETPFGRVTFKVSGGTMKNREISVAGLTVSFVEQARGDYFKTPEPEPEPKGGKRRGRKKPPGKLGGKYVDFVKDITPEVAKKVLSALVKDLPTTSSRADWLKKNPIEIDEDTKRADGVENWTPEQRRAAAIIYALTKYSEEQRTHGGKQMRGGLRTIAGGGNPMEAFAGEHPLVPQAKTVNTLRKLIKDWFNDRLKDEVEAYRLVELSEASELEEDEAELVPVHPTAADAMRIYQNGTVTKKTRRPTLLTQHFVASKPVKRTYDEAFADPAADEPEPPPAKLPRRSIRLRDRFRTEPLDE